MILVCCSVLKVNATASIATNHAESHATLLLYHHVSSDTPPSTSLSVEQFESHLHYLNDHHVVLPLTEIVNKLQTNKTLPDKAVAITFDDGYRNILENAHPLLEKYAMPYTVFISPSLIGTQSDQLNWSEVKAMSKQGVTFANHTSKHDHLLSRKKDENDQQWLARIMADIETAEERLDQEVGYSLKWLAYPYGEYNLLLKTALVARDYIGFGQQSGGVSHYSDFGALPRFPAAGIYANLTTLKTKMASLAMPVTSAAHEPLRALNQQPEITFRLDSKTVKPAQVTCFYNSAPLPLALTEETVTFILPAPLAAGRTRVNCTAPSAERGRFYWHSQAFVVPTENGVFID